MRRKTRATSWQFSVANTTSETACALIAALRMRGSRGWKRGSGPPPLRETTELYGCFAILVRIPWKTPKHQASIQCFGHGSLLVVIGTSLPLSTKTMLSELSLTCPIVLFKRVMAQANLYVVCKQQMCRHIKLICTLGIQCFGSILDKHLHRGFPDFRMSVYLSW